MTSVEPGDTLGENFTSYWVAPKYCFKGNVTAQPNFWTSTGSQVCTHALYTCFQLPGPHGPSFFASWQWNYDRSFDDYVIADATDVGCVIRYCHAPPRAPLRLDLFLVGVAVCDRYLRACCGSEHYYEASDATVRVAAGPDDGFADFCVQTSEGSAADLQAEVTINCDAELAGSVIDSLTFACYGNPSGSCSGDVFYYHGAIETNANERSSKCFPLQVV